MRIGVFMPNWIGDAVMATPTLRGLRACFGSDLQLSGILNPLTAELFRGGPWFDQELLWDRRSRLPDRASSTLVSRLQAAQFDRVLLLTNSLRTAWYAYRSGAARRLGYARGGRSWLLNERLRPLQQGGKYLPISAVDYYLDLAARWGVDRTDRQLTLSTTAAEEQAADAVWQVLGLSAARRIVALNTGGAYGAAKDWPAESFARLASRLAIEDGCHVLVLCGPAERENAGRIVAQAQHPAVSSLAGFPVSIGLTKAVLRRCGLLVTTDSGPRHIGAAFQIPTVSLFGPTDPRWSHNYQGHSVELQNHVPCGPCARRTCPLGHHRCMNELSVETVLRAVRDLLRTTARPQAA